MNRRDVSSARGERVALSLVVSRVLLVIDLLALALTLATVHGPTRFVIGVLFASVVPGWSLVGLVKLSDAALEISLSVATSLALLIILAQAMTALGAWHPVALEELVSLACVPSLAWQSRRYPRSRVRE